MESYIVRIYRRSRKELGEVAGLVEMVGNDEKRAFQSFSGLITAVREAIDRNEKNAEFTTTDLYGKDDTDMKKPGGLKMGRALARRRCARTTNDTYE